MNDDFIDHVRPPHLVRLLLVFQTVFVAMNQVGLTLLYWFRLVLKFHSKINLKNMINDNFVDHIFPPHSGCLVFPTALITVSQVEVSLVVVYLTEKKTYYKKTIIHSQ